MFPRIISIPIFTLLQLKFVKRFLFNKYQNLTEISRKYRKPKCQIRRKMLRQVKKNRIREIYIAVKKLVSRVAPNVTRDIKNRVY